ncbi:protein of unknown function [Candidatus Filomicrobium marinum]|uniref:Uncharacterized protein n=1 Tax=Candidatus Filomicrobium marinum TaxID=1608628 RepID=A0A0D6JAF8_9HYPH|nr:protein of unknown function [Candidatus Filomicrobium marinum]CPR15538.1 protein of unknown function [Candidatus Filomicrobium marinum]
MYWTLFSTVEETSCARAGVVCGASDWGAAALADVNVRIESIAAGSIAFIMTSFLIFLHVRTP